MTRTRLLGELEIELGGFVFEPGLGSVAGQERQPAEVGQRPRHAVEAGCRTM